MTQKDKQALLRVRSQARLVRELRERLEDTKAAIGAAALDGMPRGKGGLPRGLEMKVMLRETLEESLKREEKRLRDYEKEAREAMIGMKSGAYAFCLYYYICGMNLEDTARITDRCERQIRRYKREIEKEERIRLYINSVSKNMPIQMFVYLFDIFKQSTNGAIYKPIPYLGDIRLFIAEDTEKIVFHRSEEVINFWRENCIGDVTVIMIPGNHLTCFTDVNNIQKLVNMITEK